MAAVAASMSGCACAAADLLDRTNALTWLTKALS
jgi:hypothetical protein